MCCPESNESLISYLTGIAQVLIAVANLILLFYVFVYQRNQDKKNDQTDWFKDLIIIPKIDFIYQTFESILDEMSKLRHGSELDVMNTVQKEIKSHTYRFNRRFISILFAVETELAEELKSDMEVLESSLIKAIYDEQINLMNSQDFTRKVENPIDQCTQKLIAALYNADIPTVR